ncbi:hypothetical protein M0R45_006429 [Rubus argutus]|uniref:Uncharacterized protein n=1 Tax=Rubus argutus TaxID=59490 RepID=A0AAW1YR52_RUBAR
MAVLISVCQFPTINQFHSKAVSFSSTVYTQNHCHHHFTTISPQSPSNQGTQIHHRHKRPEPIALSTQAWAPTAVPLSVAPRRLPCRRAQPCPASDQFSLPISAAAPPRLQRRALSLTAAATIDHH